MQQASITSVGLIGLFIGIVIVIGLFSALFSARFWAALAGIVGTFVLLAGGLLLASAIIFAIRGIPDQATVFAVAETAPPVVSRQISVAAPDFLSGETSDLPPKAELSAEKQEGAPTGAPRPAWMNGQMGRVGDVYRTSVKVGPAFSRTECEKQLPTTLQDAVQTYADHLLGEGRGRFVHLPAAYIRNRLVRGEWEERRETTYDTMFTLHELVEFDREANEAIEANYRQSVVMGRLAYTAAGGGLVLGLLTILFCYLKLDTLTRGYYTGRLRLTAAVAILALAAVAGLLAIG